MKTKVLTLCTNCETDLSCTDINEHIRINIPKEQYGQGCDKNIFNVFTDDSDEIFQYTNEIFCCKECFMNWFISKLKETKNKNQRIFKNKRQDVESYFFKISLDSLLKLMEVKLD